MLVDRKYFLLIEKKHIYTIWQLYKVDIVVNSNIQTSTHPSSYQQISEFVNMHQYQNELIPLQLKRLKSAKIYIKIDLLHLKRLQLRSLFPLTQPMHVQNLIKTLTLIAKWSYVSINTTQTSSIHDVTLTSLTVLWTSWWTSYSIISCCRTS